MYAILASLAGPISQIFKYIAGKFFGLISLSISNDNFRTHFITPDYDDNRQIFRVPNQSRLSYSTIRVCFRILSGYNIKIHKIDLYIYHPDDGWVEARDHEIYYTSREIGKYYADLSQRLKESSSLFFPIAVKENESAEINVFKVLCSSISIDHGYRKIEDSLYVDIFLILHTNTRFLFLPFSIPEASARHNIDAIVFGDAVVYDHYDRSDFIRMATGLRENFEVRSAKGRLTVRQKT